MADFRMVGNSILGWAMLLKGVGRTFLLVMLVAGVAGCKSLRATDAAMREEAVRAQQTIKFGKYEVKPEINVLCADAKRQREYAKSLGDPVGGKLNVLMQFERIPDAEMRRELAARGAELGGYVGGNAYFAQVREGAKPNDFAGTGAIAVVALRPEWKISPLLEGASIPEWADRGNGLVEVVCAWFSNVDADFVRSFVRSKGFRLVGISGAFSHVTLIVPRTRLLSLAAEPWVQHVGVASPPSELFRNEGF